jgi:hypothetical protein
MKTTPFKLIIRALTGAGFIVAAAVGARAGVVWQSAQTITSSYDVANSGTTVVAYETNNTGDQTVNNVTFTNSTTGVGGVTLSFNGYGGSTPNAFNSDAQNMNGNGFFTPAGADGTAYGNVLAGGWWGYQFPASVSVAGLTEGHTYLVQFWVADYRGQNRSMTLSSGVGDNSPTLNYGGANPTAPGSFVTGTFTAGSTGTEVFTLAGPAPDNSTQVNAIQFRDITGVVLPEATNTTTWQAVGTITTGDDVNQTGSSVLAIHAGGTPTTVNGVVFAGNATTTQNGVTAWISQANQGYKWAGWNGYNGFNHGLTLGNPDGAAYTDVIATEYYGNSVSNNRPDPIHVSLTGLQVDHDYLVQFWVADYRGDYGLNETVTTVNGTDSGGTSSGKPVLTYHYGANGSGSFVTGTFKAHSLIKSFDIQGIADAANDGFSVSTLAGLQLRDITGAPPAGTNSTTWQAVRAITNGDDVSLTGAPLLAIHAGAAPTTVKGVVFAGNASITQNGVTVSISQPNQSPWVGQNSWNGFNNGITLGNPDGTAYTDVIATEYYVSGGSNNTADPIHVSLSGLQVGHDYLVQLWVADYRGNYGLNETVTTVNGTDAGGTSTGKPVLTYHYGANGSGSYVIGTFKAHSLVKSFDIQGIASAANDGFSMTQFAGLQLRETTGLSANYQNWANNIPGFTDTAPTHDPDGDGMTNQQEYAFGLDPTSGASVNPIVVPFNKTLGTFSYTRPVPATTGLSYAVYTSIDLNNWTVDTGATQTVMSSDYDVETVEVTLTGTKPLGASKLFVRVAAE